MFKMYVAEVLSKRVVVQHIPLGSLLSWDEEEISKDTVSVEKPSVALPEGGRSTTRAATFAVPTVPTSNVSPR